MTEQEPPPIETMSVRNASAADSVVIRGNPFAAIAGAAGSAPALALAAVIVATTTMLTMSAAEDFAEAKLYSSRGFSSIEPLRWESGARLAVAVIALLLALIGGIRYARSLPATRYVFSDDGEEASESVEGEEPAGWVGLLVGAAVIVAVLAIVLNGVAFATTLHLHESPNFGLPTG